MGCFLVASSPWLTIIIVIIGYILVMQGIEKYLKILLGWSNRKFYYSAGSPDVVVGILSSHQQASHHEADKCQNIDGRNCHEQVKLVQIALPDALRRPRAMMVIPVHAYIALPAMVRPPALLRPTFWAYSMLVLGCDLFDGVLFPQRNAWVRYCHYQVWSALQDA